MAERSAERDDDRSIRLGVFGGTFDPPHIGHVSVARGLQESGALDEILWIPAGLPPHKPCDEVLDSCGSCVADDTTRGSTSIPELQWRSENLSQHTILPFRNGKRNK